MWLIGVVSTKCKIFVSILACVVELKQNQACFSLHLTVWSRLQLAQMSISRDLMIFMLMTTTTDGQTDYFTPGACVQGNHAVFLGVFVGGRLTD